MKITVIGGGPGGYEAAIAAAKNGAEVVLIEKSEVGGTCLNRGCIPTKSLLASYEVFETVKEAKKFGVNIEGAISVDYSKVIERKNKITASLVKGIHYLLEQHHVTYLRGFGKLIDQHTILVTKEDGSTETVATDYIILATGSVPLRPELFRYNGINVITSDELLQLQDVPESMLIVGGGAIGCEIAQFLNRFGTDVTIVEMLPQILSSMDADVAKQLEKQLKREKIKVITQDAIVQVTVAADHVSAMLQSGKKFDAQYLLVAIGRVPFTSGLGLEDAQVDLTKRGRVGVNEYLQTSVDNIYAIGDLLESPMLAHVASKEAIIAVENIIRGNQTISTYHAVPGCVYTNPEIATVGYTEAELNQAGLPYRIGSFDFKGLGKAQAIGKISGFVKVITDETDVVIGGAVVGAHASDMLQVLTTATQLKLTAKQVGDCIFPHPTMSEAIMEALHDLHGVSIHKA